MKFGGTSVGDTEKIKGVARRLVAAREGGNRVVGVLSAMGDTTDELIAPRPRDLAEPHPREYDMLVSVGERISNALCAMAIHDLGHEAISLTGSQAGIVTDAVARQGEDRRGARAAHPRGARRGQIVLVAGFQGVSADSHDVTTLGRGGSDTDRRRARGGARRRPCEIYTDVEGVFTADPRLVPDARKLAAVTLRGDARDGGDGRAGDGGCARSSSRAATMCGSTCARRSATPRARGSARRTTGAREGDHLRRRAHTRGETALPRARRIDAAQLFARSQTRA